MISVSKCMGALLGLVLSLGILTEAQIGGTGTLGGWFAVDPSDQGVRDASVFAVGELARRDNSQFVYQLGSIQSASRQVVAGTNYNITLVLQSTNCPTSTVDPGTCQPTNQKTCTVLVWVQTWQTSPRTLSNFTCTVWSTATSNASPALFTSGSAAICVIALAMLPTLGVYFTK